MVMDERPVGNLEKLFVVQNRKGMIREFVVAATYSVPLTVETLYPALADLVSNEPLLGANVYKSDTPRPKVRKLARIDLDKVVTFLPHQKFDAQFVDYFFDSSRPLPYDDDDRPLWRAQVLDSHIVVWSFDHTLFDGSSGVYFHQKLLACLRRPQIPLKESTVKTSKKPLPENIENIIDCRPSTPPPSLLRRALRSSRDETAPPEHSSQFVPWAGTSPSWPPRSRTAFLSLPPDKVKDLIRTSRKHGITLTGLLYSALMQAILEAIPIGDETSWRLKTSIPINARRYFPSTEPQDGLGCYILFHEYDLEVNTYSQDISPGLFVPHWGQKFHFSLHAHSDSPEVPAEWARAIGEFKNMNMEKTLEDQAQKSEHMAAAEISNIGLVSMDNVPNTVATLDPSAPQAQITDLWFIQPGVTIGSPIILSVIGLKNGNTNVALSVAADDKQASSARNLLSSLCAVLNDAAGVALPLSVSWGQNYTLSQA
uniref:ARAD1B03938p n=1 Tax=Blastobotrys adeninivorans TaxID=409370 RepID=A0A060T4J1_BLAAD